MPKLPKYADLGDFDEDKRIDIIGEAVMKKGITVGFIVDDIPGKPERYIEKLKAKFPGIQILYKGKCPVAKTISVKVGPPVTNPN